MDLIRVRRIRALGRHGANAGERDQPQPFDIDVAVELDLRAAERSDDLTDTLDYDALRTRLIEIVETTSFALLERLCGALIETIFEDRRISRADVSIAKPQALAGATPSVSLRRENPNFGS